MTTEETKGNKYIPVYKIVSAKGNLFENKPENWRSKLLPRKCLFNSNRSQKLTANEINAMMTIPRVSLSLSETAAMACPPIMLFRIKKLWSENTFKIHGSAAA